MFLVPCAAFHPCAFGFAADAFNEFPAKSLSLGETSHSAEGLVQFDSSGNASIRKMILRAVSPHPDPLPRGEGAARNAQWNAERVGLFSAERRVHLLLKGLKGEG